MPRTLYHSALKQLGPVRVTVKSDVLKSKFSKPNAPKPDYVILEIAGEEWNYSLENPTCGDVFEGQKGNTFTVVAEGGGKGKEDTATVVYVGEAADGNDGDTAPAAPARPAPAPRAAAPKGVTPHNTTAAPARPAAAAPTRPATPPAKTTHFGATVGMCVKAAVDYCIAEGVAFDPNVIYERASDLVRVAERMEGGTLAAPFSRRMAAPPAE